MALSTDGFTVRLLLDEIAPLVKGLKIRAITLRDTLFEISLEGDKIVRLSSILYPDFSIICLRQGKAKSSVTHIDRFESYVCGATLIEIDQIGLDRVVVLDLKTSDEKVFHIYIEIISPFPNVFLTDESNILLEPLFSKALLTKKRALARGLEYKPPQQEKINPLTTDLSKLHTISIANGKDAMSKFAGFGKLLSSEVRFRMESGLGFQDAFSSILDQFKSRKIKPCTFEASEQIIPKPPHMGMSWFIPTIPGIKKIEPARSLNSAACHLLDTYLRTAVMEKRKAEAVQLIKRRISKLQHCQRQLPDPTSELSQAETYRKFADLLLANMSKIRKGQRKAKVVDLYSPDQADVEIPLCPELSPQLNVEAYFKKSRKARNRASFAEGRKLEIQKDIERLKDLLAKMEGLPAESQELKIMISSGNLEKQIEPAGTEKIDEKAERLGIRPRKYIITEGWTVVVGRSAQENEILTHKYASPQDLWFHARQVQGSHVIIRRGKTKKQVSKKAILEAAAIAAYYSKARTSKNVPVSYTEKRYVKKVRKGPPGLCTLLREKVVIVDPGLPSQQPGQRPNIDEPKK